MRTRLALFCRAAKTDLRLYSNHCRAGFISFRFLDSFSNFFQIVAILHNKCLETERLEAFLYILSKRNIGASLNRNLVGIIEDNQLAKSQCSRK